MHLISNISLPEGNRVTKADIREHLDNRLKRLGEKLSSSQNSYRYHSDQLAKQFREANLSTKLGTKHDPFYTDGSGFITSRDKDTDKIDKLKKKLSEKLRRKPLEGYERSLHSVEMSLKNLEDRLDEKSDHLDMLAEDVPPLWRPFKRQRHQQRMERIQYAKKQTEQELEEERANLESIEQKFSDVKNNKFREIDRNYKKIGEEEKKLAEFRKKRRTLKNGIDTIDRDDAPNALWLSKPMIDLSLDELIEEISFRQFGYHTRKEENFNSVLNHEQAWNETFNGFGKDELEEILSDGMPFEISFKTPFDSNLVGQAPKKTSISVQFYDPDIVDPKNNQRIEVAECELFIEEYNGKDVLVIEHISTNPEMAGLDIGKKLSTNIMTLADKLNREEIQFYAGELGKESKDAGPYYWAKFGCLIDEETKTAGGGMFGLGEKDTYVGLDRISHTFKLEKEFIIDYSIQDPTESVEKEIDAFEEGLKENPDLAIAKLARNKTKVINIKGEETPLGKLVLSGDGHHSPLKFHGKIPIKGAKPDWLKKIHEENNSFEIDMERLQARRQELVTDGDYHLKSYGNYERGSKYNNNVAPQS
jgi:hypothetical protein